MARIITAPTHLGYPLGTIPPPMAEATGFMSRVVRGTSRDDFGPFLTREEAYRAAIDYAVPTSYPEESFFVQHHASVQDVPTGMTLVTFAGNVLHMYHPDAFRFLTVFPRKCNVLGA